MKKKLLLIIPIIFAFVLCINVKAKMYDPDDVPGRSYIIGTHLLTRRPAEGSPYGGTLTTQWIMYASGTIMSADLEDRIIYYKDSDGNWINAINDEELEVTEDFYIEYVDGLEEPLDVVTPVLRRDPPGIDDPEGYHTYYFDGQKWMADVSLTNYEAIAGTGETPLADGYDLFDAITGNIVNTTVMQLETHYAIYGEPGVTQSFYAKAYKMIDGEKKYSEKSNVIELDFLNNIPAPESAYARRWSEFTTYYVGAEITEYCTENCDDGDVSNDVVPVDEIEIYRKGTDGSYTLLELEIDDDEYEDAFQRMYFVEPNKQEKLVVRVCQNIANGEKNCSPYSEELEIDTMIPTPSIVFDLATKECDDQENCEIDIGAGEAEDFILNHNDLTDENYWKAEYVDIFDENGERVLFNSTKSEDDIDNSIHIAGANRLRVLDGTSYRAKAYIVYGNEKVYGLEYSNTITFNKLQLMTAYKLDATNRDTTNDNPGVIANLDKYEVYAKDGNTVVITDKGLEAFVGGNSPEAKKWVGIIINTGFTVQGTGYTVEEIDRDDARSWGADSNDGFIVWITADQDRTITFKDINDPSSSIDITFKFVEPEEG